jgi:hypothetical protein
MPAAGLPRGFRTQRLRHLHLIVWCAARGRGSPVPRPLGLFLRPGTFPGPGSGQGKWPSHQSAWVRSAWPSA